MFRDPFDPRRLPEYTQEAESRFRRTAMAFGLQEQDPARLVSTGDRSVRFIGSVSNVFKPFLVSRTAPDPGRFLVQRCLRTRNSPSFFDDELNPEWMSAFRSFGAMVPAIQYSRLLELTLEYLFDLGVEPRSVAIEVSFGDTDLLEASLSIKQMYGCGLLVEPSDVMRPYRHVYGIEGVAGRNVNVTLSGSPGSRGLVIGNVVLIESGAGAFAAEFGTGVSTLLARIFAVKDAAATSLISTVFAYAPGLARKLADSLSASVAMMREGVRTGSRDKERLLRTYLRGTAVLSRRLGLSLSAIVRIAREYECVEYGSGSDAIERLHAELAKLPAIQ